MVLPPLFLFEEIMENKKKIIGFTAGAMDLLHAGHILMLKEAKQHCDWLIVGLHTDPTIDRPSKNKPIQSLEERRIQLQGCQYIDEIAEYDTELQLMKLLNDLSDRYKDSLVRIIGADYIDKDFTGKDLGIKTIFNSRNHNYSSSELRRRIQQAENLKSSKEFGIFVNDLM